MAKAGSNNCCSFCWLTSFPVASSPLGRANARSVTSSFAIHLLRGRCEASDVAKDSEFERRKQCALSRARIRCTHANHQRRRHTTTGNAQLDALPGTGPFARLRSLNAALSSAERAARALPPFASPPPPPPPPACFRTE